jgi:hypothetical protein
LLVLVRRGGKGKKAREQKGKTREVARAGGKL